MRGRVLPAATEPVVLKADAAGGDGDGPEAVNGTDHIQRVSLVPADPPAPAAALAALAEADQIVLGPGSLFTSVLAAVAVPGIPEGIRRVRGPHGLRGQPPPPGPETEGFDVAEHVAALVAHGVAVDVVVCDSTAIALGRPRVPVVDVPLAKANGLAHDPAKLASALADLLG